MAAPFASLHRSDPRGDVLVSWAERTARGDRRVAGPGTVQFVFYGRVSTEDWQDPVTSRARQREQAEALVRGHGVIMAELFDVGESRTVAWARRPQAAALVAQLADPDRGWDAVVIGEYERAFYGSQYAAMAPLFEHYGVQLWMPETGGRVDYASEHDEKTMTVLGLSSKREIIRTSIRVRTAMAVQTREQGRYLGGRPPYGYRLADAGPHPNKAHAAWGRRAHRLDPDPATAPTVRWIFAQRLAGHSVARIARALNEAGVPCPSAADPGRNTHGPGRAGRSARSPRSWRIPGTRADRCGTGSAPTPTGRPRQRHPRPQVRAAVKLPDGWVISNRPAHPALVSGRLHRRPRHQRRPRSGPAGRAGAATVPAGRDAVVRGVRRRIESAWTNSKPAYRCLHGRTSAMAPDPCHPKNTYIREDKLLPCLPALHLLLSTPAVRARRRTRAGADVTGTASPGEAIGYLREHEITLTWNPAAAALQARATQTAKTVTVKTN